MFEPLDPLSQFLVCEYLLSNEGEEDIPQEVKEECIKQRIRLNHKDILSDFPKNLPEIRRKLQSGEDLWNDLHRIKDPTELIGLGIFFIDSGLLSDFQSVVNTYHDLHGDNSEIFRITTIRKPEKMINYINMELDKPLEERTITLEELYDSFVELQRDGLFNFVNLSLQDLQSLADMWEKKRALLRSLLNRGLSLTDIVYKAVQEGKSDKLHYLIDDPKLYQIEDSLYEVSHNLYKTQRLLFRRFAQEILKFDISDRMKAYLKDLLRTEY